MRLGCSNPLHGVKVCPEYATSVRLSPGVRARKCPQGIRVLLLHVPGSERCSPALSYERRNCEINLTILRRNCFKTVQLAVASCLVRTVASERSSERLRRNQWSVRGTPSLRQPSAKELTPPPPPQNHPWNLSTKLLPPGQPGPRPNERKADARALSLSRASKRSHLALSVTPGDRGLPTSPARHGAGTSTSLRRDLISGPHSTRDLIQAFLAHCLPTVPPRRPITWAGRCPFSCRPGGSVPPLALIQGPTESPQPSKQV